MRVLYFTRDYTPHDHRFLTSLAESGNEVFYLRLERLGRALEDRSLPSVVTQIPWQGGQKPFEWRSLPVLLPGLRRVIYEVKPDVLHAGPIQTVAFLAALTGFHPLVTMSWGSDLMKDADRSAAYRWITRYTLSQSDAMAVDCQAVQDKAAAFGFPRERSFVFPWGIDLQMFSPANQQSGEQAEALRYRLGWQEKFVALSLRSWEPVYGVDVMLKGFARAARKNPDLRLLMLGSGSQAKLVHEIILANDLADCVHLGGQVRQSELPGMYRAADVYLSASHSDGSSVSLMEALASGLPSLVTDIPSNREWVSEGEQGWLFPDNDDAALAEKLLRASVNPDGLSAMREQARAKAEMRADWKKNFPVLLAAYDQAIRHAGKRETR